MRRLSYGEQANEIVALLDKEIKWLDSLPPEEAQKEARKGLIKVGIVDGEGNLTAPYVALRDRYV
ncbi:MAG: hypothetical protein IKQ71_06090 [Lachnospiraceae bacterium]|nr:hypothetical protein [Lachnospiraceae bacterium]